MSEKNDNHKATKRPPYIALGLIGGVVFGAVIQNIGVGIALGVAIGIGVNSSKSNDDL